MKMIAVAVFGLILLAGCSTGKMCAVKDCPEDEFKRDSYRCTMESRTSWSGGGSGLIGVALMVGSSESAKSTAKELYKLCMEAKGYYAEEVYSMEECAKIRRERGVQW